MPVKLSVIMIAYNEERYVGSAIRSILRQTRPADELIFVDDGSVDRTGSIAESLLKHHVGARVIRATNGGRAAARNTAFGQVSGDVVIIADADDESLPQRLECHAAAFESDPSLDWHSGQLRYIGEDGRETGIVSGYPIDPSLIHATLEAGDMPVAHSASAFRTRIADRVEGSLYSQECESVEDLELLLALGDSIRIVNSPEVLVRYRRTKSDRSWRKWKETQRYHGYAVMRNRMRRSDTPTPSVEDWWLQLGLMERFHLLDTRSFAILRFRDLEAMVRRPAVNRS